MFFFLHLFFIFSAVFSSLSHAQFFSQKEVLEKEFLHLNAELYSLHGSLTFLNPFGRKKRFHEFFPEQDKDSILQKEEDGVVYLEPTQKRKNEMIFMIAGIFDSAHLKDSRFFWLSYQLAVAGYDVVIYPNTFTKRFYRNFSKREAPGGDIEHNVQKIANHLWGVHQVYQPEKIHLVGFSYGAFLSAVSAYFLKKFLPDVFADLERIVLLYPPFDIYESTKILDAQFEKVVFKRGHCMPYLKLTGKMIPMALKGSKASYSGDVKYCSDFIFYGWFRDELNSYQNYLAKDLQKEISPEGIDFTQVHNFADHVRFFLEESSEFKDPQQGRLDFWLNALSKESLKIKVLTSQDDPINTDVQLPNLSSGELILFTEGGHGGLFAHKEAFFSLVQELLIVD